MARVPASEDRIGVGWLTDTDGVWPEYADDDPALPRCAPADTGQLLGVSLAGRVRTR
jgi:hypothetical protein